MRPTRFEVMNELRSILGHAEETEILIDWLQDAWQTYDALIERVGKERAYQIIHTMGLFPDAVTQPDLASYDHTNEHVDQYLLN